MVGDASRHDVGQEADAGAIRASPRGSPLNDGAIPSGGEDCSRFVDQPISTGTR
jgi:hypothetical protein